jgi:hypothetical protein
MEILHGAQADSGSLCEGGLRKPGVQSILADQIAECGRLVRLRHYALQPLGSMEIVGQLLSTIKTSITISAHSTPPTRN